MTVQDVVDKLNLKVFSGKEGLNKVVTGGYVSDLLSDVMGNAGEGEIWITLQTHKNIVAVASLRDLAAIICVNKSYPDSDALEASNREDVPILGCTEKTFEISAKLFNFITG